MQESYDDIHPELAQTSGVFRELMNAGDELMTIGIDPATAVVIAAAVPITLRILRMVNEAVSAIIQNWVDEKKLDRKRRDYELEQEFGRK